MSEDSCENISDSSLKSRCAETVVKNIQVEEIAKTQVITKYKSNEEKLGECDQLSGDSAESCKDDANYNLALEKKDISYCNEIKDSDKQSNCIKVQSGSINNFYLRQAIARKDPKLCDKILDEGVRKTCLTYAQ